VYSHDPPYMGRRQPSSMGKGVLLRIGPPAAGGGVAELALPEAIVK